MRFPVSAVLAMVAIGAAVSCTAGSGGGGSGAGGANAAGGASNAFGGNSGGNVSGSGGSTTGNGGSTTNVGGGSGSNQGGALAAGGTGGTSTGGAGGAATAKLRIMPFGDSITADTCYRARLAELLDMKHKGAYDFVGTQNGTGGTCNNNSFDRDHEGHGGYMISQHADDIRMWTAANPTDVVLFHFATNDIWNSVSTPAILAAYTAAVGEFRKYNSKVTILVAQITPMAPTGCDHCDVTRLNTAIPGWATATATADSKVIVVDQFTGFNIVGDTRDMVHPNDSGSIKVATKWNAALDPLF